MLPSKMFFDHFFDDLDSPKRFDKMMKCDIYEKGDNYVIEMDIPGFKKEDINMELDDGYLRISVEKSADQEDSDDKKYVRRERHSYSKCERQFYVGNISEENIKAKYEDGVLTVVIKKQEKKQNKIIAIE